MRTRRRTRAGATPCGRTPGTGWCSAGRPPAAYRTRGACCGPRSPAGTGPWRGNSSRLLPPVALELAQQRADLLRLERVATLAGVIEEAAAGLRTELVVRHLLLDEPRRLEPIVAQRLAHV